jgi:hypothetical protein
VFGFPHVLADEPALVVVGPDHLHAPHAAWVRSSVLAGVPELLGELGVDAQALAESRGLEPAALRQADLLVPVPAVVRLFEAAAGATRREDFGLLLATRHHLPGPA